MAGTTNSNSNPAPDLFEEYQFRPLNEGLGFHRPAAKTLSTTTGTYRPVTTPAAPSAGTGLTFAAPLPRPETNPRPAAFDIPVYEDDSIAKAQTAVNEILKNLNQKRQMDFLTETEKQKTQLKKSKPFFFAALLDGMLIMAAFLLSMIAMLTITKVDLLMNLTNPATALSVYTATAGLFLGLTFIYMLVNRAFMGFTPGEWAFDQRLGEETQMHTASYIPRLALRGLVVMATGFVLLPVLSYLFNKDLAGRLSGVPLLRKPHA